MSRNPWEGSAHEAPIGAGRAAQPRRVLAWVDATLEAAQFSAEPEHQAAVVITPMARAVLRPFGAMVLPGADAATLAAPVPRLGVLSMPMLSNWACHGGRTRRQAAGLCAVAAQPRLMLLRCRFAGADPCPPARCWQLQARWATRRRFGGTPARQPCSARRLEHGTRRRTGPAACNARATGIDALRNCPYQFFAGRVLGLRPADEIDTEADKRDYGTWLHAVLHRFRAAA